APPWVFKGFDGILAVDIGGSNIRAGVVELNLKRARDLSAMRVWKSELWSYRPENPTRDKAVDRLIEMLTRLMQLAHRKKLRLAPFIGIGCPGIIREDGSIKRGGQNLPGNWQSKSFNLPHRIFEKIPKIGSDDTSILMHNDAVVQGLSELPFMQ